MSKPRRPRTLTPEERRLWAQVAKGVKPLAGRTLTAEPEPEGPPEAPPPFMAEDPGVQRASSPSRAAGPPQPPPLAPMERKTVQSLRRGTRQVDGVIDLHGMRQAEAHLALIGFLRRAQGAGHTIVLVITGKGGASVGEGPFEERGVLRRVVPHWLRLPDLRSLVLGFEESSPHHGGSGALYVRLRRRRGAGTGI
jgi:DNA-nicking Smr family endonuclease